MTNKTSKTEKLTWRTFFNENTGYDEYYTGKEFEACIIRDEEDKRNWVLSYTDFWTVPDRIIPQMKGTFATRIKHHDIEDLKHYAQYVFEQANKYWEEKGY